MCLAADIPLVESGTQGYLGQAYVIKKDETECFDCQPKPTPTTYPVCTIRSTPSAPIHCIVWSKSFLFRYCTCAYARQKKQANLLNISRLQPVVW